MATRNPEAIRRYIIQHVPEHEADLVQVTAGHFGVTRQAVHRHVNALIAEDVLDATGTTRGRRYSLKSRVLYRQVWPNAPSLEEHVVWRDHIAPLVSALDRNVREIVSYGFSEMFNNA